MILATAFDLVAADGSYQVTVPDVVPGDNYQIVRKCTCGSYGNIGYSSDMGHTVFGDSGNIGPSFTIIAA